MPRRPTGQVIEKHNRRGLTYALRFRAYGDRQYVTLGAEDDGWTRAKAEGELRYVLAQVERGVWQPPEPTPQPNLEPTRDPTFHEFASEWLDARRGELRPNPLLDYEWQLTHHLLPFFARHRLADISIAEVDRYRQAKVREGALSVTSINKTLTRLAQILEVAVEYGLIDRNPAKGTRRRLKAQNNSRLA
jgi:integrase